MGIFLKKTKTPTSTKYILLGVTVYKVEVKKCYITKTLCGIRFYRKFMPDEYSNDFISQLFCNNLEHSLSKLEMTLSEQLIEITKKFEEYKNTTQYAKENLFYHKWITQSNDQFKENLQCLLVSSYEFMSPIQLLITLSTLIEVRAFQNPSFLMNFYVKKFGNFEIASYPLVSHFAKAQQISIDDSILKSAMFYEIVFNHSNEQNFKELLSNKSIAVVGNAPSEKGKNNKKEIDSHDIVIRFNDFVQGYNSSAYGEKVDIVCLANGVLCKSENVCNNLQAVFIEPDIAHQRFPLDYIENLLDINKKYSTPLMSFDFEFRKQLRSATKLTYPSSGFSLIYYLLTHDFNFKKLSFYGFSFKSVETINQDYANRYYEDRNADVLVWHDYEMESKIILDLLASRG